VPATSFDSERDLQSVTRLVIYLLLLGATGCQAPAINIEQLAAQSGMSRQVVAGDRFRHVVYLKPASSGYPEQTLHVYLEGDGIPWRYRGTVPADDPSSRNPLALQLMSVDPHTGLYVGRPCYMGMYNEPGCSPELWTSGRYSEQVVNSMSAVITQQLQVGDYRQLVLIGYSGGGALAVLLANRLQAANPQVTTRVVTMAANLDTDRWTSLHGFLPLSGSLNPMRTASLQGMHHRHYAGTEDTQVPVDIIADFVTQHGGELVEIEGYNHHCCWLSLWVEESGSVPSAAVGDLQ
jgi:hypothetical protein